jgi:hypothetical protein
MKTHTITASHVLGDHPPAVCRYNGTKDIDLAPLSPDVLAAIVAAKRIGYRIVPVLEIDCGKVVSPLLALDAIRARSQASD